MKSFRLYVGERRYLTGAGWLCLLFAAGVTAGVGYAYAAGLADLLGAGRLMLGVVAGCGVLTWGAAWLLFRAAGFPLIAEQPPEEAEGGERGPFG